MADAEIKPLKDDNGKPDPTGNVLLLVQAAVVRQDDLRDAERRYNDLRAGHQTEIGKLRDEHSKAMNDKESSRLDSIRQIDREEQNQKAIAAQTAITTLATSTIALKDSLQLQVQNTAVMVDNKQVSSNKEVNDRISRLELTGSEGKGASAVRDPVLDEFIKAVRDLATKGSVDAGKQSVVDPIMQTLLLEMKASRESDATKKGTSSGLNQAWIILIAVVGLIGGLIVIIGAIAAVAVAIKR